MTTPRISTLESNLEGRFYDAVRRILHGRAFKMVPTEKGMPDRLVLLPGGIIEIVELKADDGELSPKQRHWHSRAAMLGTVVTVIRGAAGLREWVAQRLADQNN